MMKHIMLDLETWGLGPYSFISQIGVAQFDPHESDPEKVVRQSFEISVDPISAQKAGMRFEAETLAWWMDDARNEARSAWMKTLKFELPLALDGLTEFVQWVAAQGEAQPFVMDYKNIAIWSNGADFDIPRLAEAYTLSGRDKPWHFYNQRCFRTLKNLTRADLRPTKTHVAHTACADAIYQATWAAKIVTTLGINVG